MQDLKCFHVSTFGMYECGQPPALSIKIHPIVHTEGPFGLQADNSLVQQTTHSLEPSPRGAKVDPRCPAPGSAQLVSAYSEVGVRTALPLRG